jgi:two-component system sensor kinase FixL
LNIECDQNREAVKNKIVNILLVEDEEAHVELMRRAFARYSEKYQLNIVGTISQARLILAASPPDIVIADMKLPDGDSI